LRTGARKLPLAIPDADETNPLAAFSGDPASYVGADVEAEELWERLSSIFHGAFDYGGSPESRERMIQPGPQGIGGFCRFLEYFVQRGLQGAMIELKVEQVLEALDSVFVFFFVEHNTFGTDIEQSSEAQRADVQSG
jgi:hypothetical protein